MTELHKLETYSFETIESFITNEIEESIHIEFKSKDALSRSDSMKKEISKDVAAFANSDGGIIIYGITEKNHKADELSFIDGDEFTKEWLEQIISSTIQRNIPDLIIYPVRKNGEIDKTIYVVQIPSSLEAPHISRDKRYYKRFNFESVFMEEYEIRQLYGRKVKSKLKLAGYAIGEQDSDDKDTIKFICEVSAFNEGEKLEDNYKINVYFENYCRHIKISWGDHASNRNYEYTRINDNRYKISTVGITPIYPDETVNIIRFNFEIPTLYIKEVLEKLKLEFLLFYPNGEDKLETDLKVSKNDYLN